MSYEWHERKRLLNEGKHGFDFEHAKALFDGRKVITVLSKQRGEPRYVTTGIVKNEFVTLVWTPRKGKVRFISFRRARNEEKKAYKKLFS